MSSGALLPSSDVHFFDSALSLMDRAFYCPDGLETLSSIPDVLTGEAPAAPPPKRKKVKARASKQMKAKPIGQRARDAYNPIYAKSALQAAIAKQKAREQKKEAENRRKGQPKVKLTKSEKRQARLQKLEARAEVKRQKRQAEKEERVMQEQANRLGVDLEMLQKHKRQLEAPTVISASEQMARLRGKLARKIEDMKARRRSEQSARDKKNKQQQRQKAKKRVRDASEAGDGEDEEESRPAKRSKRSSAAMDSGNESSDIEEDFQFAAIAQRKVDDLTALDGKKKRRKVGFFLSISLSQITFFFQRLTPPCYPWSVSCSGFQEEGAGEGSGHPGEASEAQGDGSREGKGAGAQACSQGSPPPVPGSRGQGQPGAHQEESQAEGTSEEEIRKAMEGAGKAGQEVHQGEAARSASEYRFSDPGEEESQASQEGHRSDEFLRNQGWNVCRNTEKKKAVGFGNYFIIMSSASESQHQNSQQYSTTRNLKMRNGKLLKDGMSILPPASWQGRAGLL